MQGTPPDVNGNPTARRGPDDERPARALRRRPLSITASRFLCREKDLWRRSPVAGGQCAFGSAASLANPLNGSLADLDHPGTWLANADRRGARASPSQRAGGRRGWPAERRKAVGTYEDVYDSEKPSDGAQRQELVSLAVKLGLDQDAILSRAAD